MPPITDPAMLTKIKAQQTTVPNVQPQPFPGTISGPMMKAQTPADQQLATQRGLNIQKTQDEISGKDEISDNTADYYAGLVIAGAPMPAVGMGATAAKNRQKIMDHVAAKGQAMGLGGADLATQQAHYKAASGALKTLETQRDVTGQNEETATLNGQQFIDRSHELPLQGGGPALNTAVQFLQKNLPFVPGHETKTAMDSAWQTFTTEYAKVVAGSPTGSGILSDSARREAQATMEGNADPSQKEAAFAQMKTDMANRMTAMNHAVKQGYIDLVHQPDKVAEEAKQLSTTSKTVPIPKGYQDEHIAFLKAHPPGTLTPEDYTAERNRLDQAYAADLGGAHSAMSPDEVKNFITQYNHGHSVNKIPGINMPMSQMEHLHAAAAESPLGVGAMSAADAATVGIPAALMSQEDRDKMHMAEEAHPVADFTGDLAGSVVGLGATEKGGVGLLKKLGVPVDALTQTARQKLLKMLAVNSLYGGLRGFNEADGGEGGKGAGTGALVGAGATVVGHGVGQGITPYLNKATGKSLDLLKNVKSTTLQKLGLGGMEEAFAGVPGAHGARNKSLQSFNLDNANRALANIGEKVDKGIATGTELNAHVNQKLSNAYNAIRPHIVGATDKQFGDAVAVLKATNADTPEKKAMFKEIDKALNSFKDKEGHYDGQGYKTASERLRYLTKSWADAHEAKGDVPSGDMARVAEQARKLIQQLVQRRTPEVGAQLKAIERGWAHHVRIEDATNRALTQNETQTYGPGQYITSLKKFDTSARKGASARGKTLDQGYAMAAGKVLGLGPQKKLSLKEMSIAGASLGGLGYAAPAVPGAVGTAAGLAYLPGVKKGTQALLSGKRHKFIDNPLTLRLAEEVMRHQASGKK